MGKGTIKSHDGDALYTIDYQYNTDKLDARIAGMQSEINLINTVEIPAADEAITNQYVNITDAETALNQAIGDSDPAEKIQELTVALNAEKRALDNLERNKHELQMKAIELDTEIDYLISKRIEKEEVSAWCADHNTALSGEVGVMEFPGEAPGTVKPAVIRPAGVEGDLAVYAGDSDGAMTQTLALTPEETFLDLALMPGWQRWKPLYRIGTIISLDHEANTCQVLLENNKSSYQGLDTIPEGNTTLSNVPVEYMSCNSAAFKVSDKVVVKFDAATDETIRSHGIYTGKVIGFENNPRPCGARYWRFVIANVYSAGGVDGFIVNDKVRDLLITEIELYARTQEGIYHSQGVVWKSLSPDFYYREHETIADLTVSGGSGGSNLIDDDIDTYWSAPTYGPWWIEVDFGVDGEGNDKLVDVAWANIGVDLNSSYWTENPGYYNYIQTIDLDIQYKADQNWVTKKSFYPMVQHFGHKIDAVYNFRSAL
jgi:hypothetical protein